MAIDANLATEIDGINHVGMAVRDLPTTVSQFERLGFFLTPFSPQSGAMKPNEAVKALGSGNRCVMFANNYLEILASEDPRHPSPRIAKYLERHQGAHIICFNSEDLPSLDLRLRALGIGTSGVIPLQRDIDTSTGTMTAKFERIQFAPDDSPEGYIQAARHLTPEYIYQPRYLTHPNGCECLSEAIVATTDLAYFAEKYTRYLDVKPHFTDDTVVFVLGSGSRLVLASPRTAAALLPGSLMPPMPGIAGVAFRTTKLDAQRHRLSRMSVTFAELPGRLIVPAEEASGVAIIFEEGAK